MLYERLAGERAFPGEDVTDTLANIVRGIPDRDALPPRQVALVLPEDGLVAERGSKNAAVLAAPGARDDGDLAVRVTSAIRTSACALLPQIEMV